METSKKLVVSMVILFVSIQAQPEMAPANDGPFALPPLRYGYYEEACLKLEEIVLSTMIMQDHRTPAQLLRLLFHDCFIQAGGPYYPVLTGRRDSTESYFDKAMAEIPRPHGNISETLRLFSLRGFDERETVALLGGHNIGNIGCQFIRPRLRNFMGSGLPDPTIPSDFLEELKRKCPDNNSTINNMFKEHTVRSLISESTMSYSQGLSAVGASFDNHYYKTLMRGKGILFADQQLMANEKTTAAVVDYASDDGTIFRIEFALAMGKLSNLGVLTGSQGEVRRSCSHLNSN